MFFKTVGHQKQKDLFAKLIENQTLGQGYVFSGPENVGKTTFATDLAIHLTGGSPLDLMVFDREIAMDIQEARAMQRMLYLSPVAQKKVAIIAGAEQLNTATANCLLKILEEPPEHCLVILVTSNFYGLLPTVASRMQRISFAAMSEEEVRLALREQGYEEVICAKAASLCFGRFGLAKTLADDETYLSQVVLAQDVYETLVSGDLRARLQTAQKIAEMETAQIRQIFKYAMHLWVAAGGNRAFGTRLFTAFTDLGANLNAKLVLDNLFLTEQA